MTLGRRIEAREFNASIAPSRSRQNRKRQSTRNLSWVLGLAGTLTLHGIAFQSLIVGSSSLKARPPEVQGAGSLRVGAVTAPTEELVLVTVAEVPKADPDLMVQITSLVPQIEQLPISIVIPDPLPAVDLASADPAAQESSRSTPAAGDRAMRALMFGRYTGQISARIERAWVRPRSPVNDDTEGSESSTGDDVSTSDETFRCRVQIRQDARGNVQEVLLLKCNGTEAWRHSLVVAINQSSPLPAPPIPTVFTRALNMTFEAQAYGPGGAADEYEIEPRAVAQPLGGTRLAVRAMTKTSAATYSNGAPAQ
jgi:hypothetical protein